MPEIQGPKAQDIQKIFTSVAHGYDRANDYITFGMARSWRRRLVRWSKVQPGQRVLDCATGTGDLAIEFKKAVGPEGEVIGTDFCKAMLDRAPQKAMEAGLEVEFRAADVLELPFPDSSFDVCSIAYGIRNVEDPKRALNEMSRVVKPGGVVMVIETGDSQWPLFSQAFDVYCKYVMPTIGGLATGQPEAYRYLNQSSSKFPSREHFVELMMATEKFSKVEYLSLLGGASFIYKGQV